MNLAERYPPTPELAQAYSSHGTGHDVSCGWFSRGIAYAEKIVGHHASRWETFGVKGNRRASTAACCMRASRFEECIERCREAVRLLRAHRRLLGNEHCPLPGGRVACTDSAICAGPWKRPAACISPAWNWATNRRPA